MRCGWYVAAFYLSELEGGQPAILFTSWARVIPEYRKHYEYLLASKPLMTRAHSFPRQNLTKSTANLVNSASQQMKFRGSPRIHSYISTCYELMNPSLFIH